MPVDDTRHNDRGRTSDCIDHLACIGGIIDPVELRQHDHRLSATVDRHHQQPLEPTGLDRPIKPEHHCDGIDVAGEDLFKILLSRIAATDRSATRQHPIDHRAETLCVGEFDPISGDGSDLALRSLRIREHTDPAPPGHHIALAAVDTHDPGPVGRGNDIAPATGIHQGDTPVSEINICIHEDSVCLTGTIPRADAFLRHGF